MRIGLVGWGLESQSAFRFFGPDNEYLIVNESEQDNFPKESDKIKVQYLVEKAPIGISGQVADLDYLKGIDKYDKIVYQPTAYFNLKKAFGDNKDFWAKATTVYDIFFEEVKGKNIIGVTGSKGKGTTSTLITKILESSGKTVHLGGNIGTPILDLLPQIQTDDWIVWELANFQLKTASYSPHIAVCLMITEEHLDWHPNFEDYIEAKANIFRHQRHEDVAIYFSEDENSKKIAEHSIGKKIPYYQKPGAYVRQDSTIVLGQDEMEVIKTDQLKLLGKHNWQNVCAAITAAFEVSQDLQAMRQVLTSFSGLEHRLEFVKELEGIKYYDDSFATTPDSAIVAIRAFTQPVVMVLGGHDKKLPLDGLIDEITRSDHVRHVVTIGEIGPTIAQMLRKEKYNSITEGLTNTTDIVAECRKQAQPGDVVLLSCGTSSFGMFKDYKDRGEQFKKAVRELS